MRKDWIDLATLKNNIRHSTKPFDGNKNSRCFKRAIGELRKEGYEIIYIKEICSYLNITAIEKQTEKEVQEMMETYKLKNIDCGLFTQKELF